MFATLAALVIELRVERHGPAEFGERLGSVWRVLGYVASAALFLLVGFAFTREIASRQNAHWRDDNGALGGAGASRGA